MKKKNHSGIIWCLLFIIIILIVFIVLLLTGVINLNTNDKNESTKTIHNDNVVETTSIKLDDTKDYVYDAEYKTDNKYTEFMRYEDGPDDIKRFDNFGIEVEYSFGMQYLNKLKVPYININSSYAKVANATLEKLYLDNAKTFDLCAEEAKGTEPSCSQILTYKTYTYDNILSVVVIDGLQATSTIALNYHIYNFDLTTGDEIKYYDIMNKLNYNRADVEEQMKTLLKNKMDSLYGKAIGDLSNACYGKYNEETKESEKFNCYEKANELFIESVNKEEVLFFTDNDGKLNIFAIPYANVVQDGDRNYYLFTINK